MNFTLEIDTPPTKSISNASMTPVCAICIFPVNPDEVTTLCCGHEYCSACWDSYTTYAVDKTKKISIDCPQCQSKITDIERGEGEDTQSNTSNHNNLVTYRAIKNIKFQILLICFTCCIFMLIFGAPILITILRQNATKDKTTEN